MRVYVEGHPDTHWMAHLLEQPGCIWLAGNRDDLLTHGPGAVDHFRRWLTRNGEPEVHLGDTGLEVVDVRIVANFGQSGADVALFEPDLEPVTDQDIAVTIRRLGYARRELLELVTSLPAEAMDREPPAGKRTLRQNLDHIRDCQGFYLSRLLEMDRLMSLFDGAPPDGTLQSLHWMGANLVRLLLQWPEELRQGTYQAARPAEEWTSRKMLRRILEHEVEHIWVIRRTIQLRPEHVLIW